MSVASVYRPFHLSESQIYESSRLCLLSGSITFFFLACLLPVQLTHLLASAAPLISGQSPSHLSLTIHDQEAATIVPKLASALPSLHTLVSHHGFRLTSLECNDRPTPRTDDSLVLAFLFGLCSLQDAEEYESQVYPLSTCSKQLDPLPSPPAPLLHTPLLTPALLSSLTRLQLDAVVLPDTACRYLRHCTALTSLSLRGTPFHLALLPIVLSSLPSLSRLSLLNWLPDFCVPLGGDDKPLGAQVFSAIAGLTRLTQLDIEDTPFSASHLRQLISLPSLSALELKESVHDASHGRLEPLACLPSLSYLYLSLPASQLMPGDFLVQLSGLTHLCELDIHVDSPAGCVALAGLTRLTKLVLSSRSHCLLGPRLCSLQHLRSMRHMAIHSEGLDYLQYIQPLTALEKLLVTADSRMGRQPFTPAHGQQLTHLSLLTELQFAKVSLQRGCLRPMVKPLVSLTRLEVYYCTLPDQVVLDVARFESLTSFRLLRCDGHKKEAERRLARQCESVGRSLAVVCLDEAV